jgi:hypothetical protein
MQSLHDFVKALDDVKEALIAVTSTVSVAAVCARIIWDKFKRKK